MNINEYLAYHVSAGSLLKSEMNLFGVPNLKKGWMHRHGSWEIPADVLFKANKIRESHTLRLMMKTKKAKK